MKFKIILLNLKKHRKWWIELLISEITGSVTYYPVLHKKMSCLFLSLSTYLLNIVISTTQTLAQIKSQEFIGHIENHFITTGRKEGNVLFNDTLNIFYLRLAARVLLYASSHRQDNTYHGLCYPSRGALAGTRNSSMGLSQQVLSHMSQMAFKIL